MNDNYILMHKDIQCGVVAIDRISGALSEFKVIDPEHAPFLGNANENNMKIWWKHRAVPGSRTDMAEIIRKAGCDSNLDYLAKNLALSITDTYWICPLDLELSWDDVNLHRRSLNDQGILSYQNGTSYDPNASLGGQMSKYWDISGESPVLVKRAYEYYGQQSVNEFFATELHVRQNSGIPFVRYSERNADDNAVLSCCEAFTDEHIEFISAYEVMLSAKQHSGVSDCDHYIAVCDSKGLPQEEMQRFLDYLILTDFAVSNIDEHLQNFGILRNADTLEFIGPAPIFDSGNSMFFNRTGSVPLNRSELLEQEIRSMHTSEEKMLKHVKDPSVLDPDKLPSPDEAAAFYLSHGITEAKCHLISGSYRNKLSLLNDFMKGIKISLYLEKQRGMS